MSTTTRSKADKPKASRTSTASSSKAKVFLNDSIENEISRIAELQNIDKAVLQEFAYFVIDNYKKPATIKPKTIKPLSLAQLKKAVFQHFEVETLTELRKSSSFQMATGYLGKLDFAKKDGWETVYRKCIGVLPNEENETGYGCINGVNIFNYDLPWRIFGLDPKTATTEEIKVAYRNLSKKYHPDIPETGDKAIFERLNVFYRSLTERF